MRTNALYITLISLFFTSCSFSGAVDVQVTLPQTYDGAAVTTWAVTYYDDTFAEQECHAASGETITLSLSKNVCTPLIIAPDCTFCLWYADRPLGALYPATTDFSAAGGFVATILRTLYRASDAEDPSQTQVFLMRFNWTRLLATCAEYPDPYLLDRERIVTQIAKGTFTAKDVRLKESR